MQRADWSYIFNWHVAVRQIKLFFSAPQLYIYIYVTRTGSWLLRRSDANATYTSSPFARRERGSEVHGESHGVCLQFVIRLRSSASVALAAEAFFGMKGAGVSCAEGDRSSGGPRGKRRSEARTFTFSIHFLRVIVRTKSGGAERKKSAKRAAV